jgi:glycosyltransferase involved in cell wall biosynthesis
VLSLCVIVRDEASLLPACLASVEGLVDELVVCDTGSLDRSVEIARAAGAVVVHHAWDEDFAGARNAALDAASGDWILVLDADERLSRGGREALRRALAEDDFDLGLLPLHNASRLDASEDEVLSGRARRGAPVLLARLFRRDPSLRWEGRVHETPRTWLARGPRARTLPADLIHLGCVPELRAAKGKDARNLALLERRCQDDPGDPVG